MQEIRNVDRPQVVEEFFADSNSIDKNNQARQYELALEKRWVTKDPYFRLVTTKVGIDVAGAWKLMLFHDLFPSAVTNRYAVTDKRKVPMKAFAGILGGELLELSKRMKKEEEEAQTGRIDELDDVEEEEEEEEDASNMNQTEEHNNIVAFDDGRGNIIQN